MAKFVQIAEQCFSFLEDEYGFVIDKIEDTYPSDGGGVIIYINKQHGMALSVQYSFMGAYVYIDIYKLINGEIIENDEPITESSNIYKVDFDFLVPKAASMKHSFEYGDNSPYHDEKNGLYNFVSEFAKLLRKHGHAILSGDWSEFHKAERIIRKRVRKNK